MNWIRAEDRRPETSLNTLSSSFIKTSLSKPRSQLYSPSPVLFRYYIKRLGRADLGPIGTVSRELGADVNLVRGRMNDAAPFPGAVMPVASGASPSPCRIL